MAPRGRADKDRLVAEMIEPVRQYGCYGYRRIAVLLRDAGWRVNEKRPSRACFICTVGQWLNACGGVGVQVKTAPAE